METAYANRFRNILRRLTAPENSEKYNAICTLPMTDDENRIWELCQKFWPEGSPGAHLNIEEYKVNDIYDDFTANRYLSELETLLDKHGWKKD